MVAAPRSPTRWVYRVLTLLLLFAGLVNREQARVLDYLRKENRMVREQLGKKRLRLNDSERARFAAGAKALARSVLDAVATPETLLPWQPSARRPETRHRPSNG
jgi:hypothetical protein